MSLHTASIYAEGAAVTLLGAVWASATSADGRYMETVRCGSLRHQLACGCDHGVNALYSHELSWEL